MSGPQRRIDHLVLAVHDLDAAADRYEQLGFQVGARNRHPWGTENRLVQFGSSFLELITVADEELIPPHAPGFFSFGAFVRDYLRRREGLAMFVLDSVDARADATTFAEAGIGDFRPFSFEREGRQPDGTPTHVGFSLAYAIDDRVPAAAFFVCQQHHPDAFWNPLLQRHPNGAVDVTAVTLELADPPRHAAFLETFTGSPLTTDGREIELAGSGRLVVETAGGTPGFVAYTVGVCDLDRVAQRLSSAHLAVDEAAGRIGIPADEGFGVRIEFEATTDRATV